MSDIPEFPKVDKSKSIPISKLESERINKIQEVITDIVRVDYGYYAFMMWAKRMPNGIRYEFQIRGQNRKVMKSEIAFSRLYEIACALWEEHGVCLEVIYTSDDSAIALGLLEPSEEEKRRRQKTMTI